MKECFIHKVFNSKHLAIIKTADDIMRQYAKQGYDLSLRQLYYQFVAHHDLANTEQSYKMLGDIISDARLAGLLDWDVLVDRGRETISNSHWNSPADIIDSAASSFRIDLWEDQPCHVEVMVEKQALEGVLVPVCRKLDIPFSANKGYSSSSAMYGVGQRLKDRLEDGKNIIIVYLGDHDPSGIDMTRDVRDRLAMFSEAGEWIGSDLLEDHDIAKPQVIIKPEYEDRFKVVRICLNMDQIRKYKPPPNPAKMSDSRALKYVSMHGNKSWELDALDPAVLAALVTTEVNKHIDADLWGDRVLKMETMKDELKDMAAEYRGKQDE